MQHPRTTGCATGIVLLLLALCGCAAPVLLMPGPGQLMWALLQPLVGFDPNAVNLFEQPLVKQRMTALLGEHYAPAMQLLRTADELKREGPLFYLASRYTPVPDLADKAGLVWNADTNQMAALLAKGDVVQVFAETVQAKVEARVGGTVQALVPKWPAELAPFAALAVPALEGALDSPSTAGPAVTVPTGPATPSAAPPGAARAQITGPSSPGPGIAPPP